MKAAVLHIALIFFASTIVAQNIPVRDAYMIRNIEKESLVNDSSSHTSIKPYYYSDYKQITGDYLHLENSLIKYKKSKESKANSSEFGIAPAFHLFSGSSNSLYNSFVINTYAGAEGYYHLGDKLSLNFILGLWYDSGSIRYNGLYYRFYTDLRKLDYGSYFGERGEHLSLHMIFENDIRLTYSPFDFIKLELANSRNVYGEGHRTFMLSDFSKPYPYLKLETSFLSLKYSCIWSIHRPTFMNFGMPMFVDFPLNYNVFHYLDWKIGSRVNLGLFEAIISNNSRFFSFEYLNPIIFFRPVEFSMGSEDNAVLGASLKIKLSKSSAFYSQFVLDDLIVGQFLNDIRHNINPDYEGEYGWFANKWAAQFGVKTYDIFKISNLDFFTEINIARPYVYSHVHIEQNYSHAGRPLAHPLGANFIESISGLSYYGERFFADAKLMYALVGTDSVGTHFGQDIFLPTMDGNQGYLYRVNSYGNTILQGVKTNIISASFEFAYKLLENKNLYASLGIIVRNYSTEVGNTNRDLFINMGIKSDLNRRNFIY